MQLDDYIEHLPPLLPAEEVRPVAEHLLRKCPVAHSDQDGGFWIVNRHADLSRVMQDWRTFETGTRGVYVPTLRVDRPAMAPLEVNEPLHRKVKDVLSRFLTPQALRPHEDRMRQIIAARIDEFADSGRCDIARDFAKKYPADIINEIFMGIKDPEEIEKIQGWARLLTYEMTTADPSVLVQAQKDWREWCHTLISQRRKDPRDDIPTAVAVADIEVDGVTMPDEDLVSVLQLVLLAGYGTTSDATSTIVIRLIEDQTLEQTLREDPSQIPAAIEECLRLDPPVTTRPRRPKEDVVINGREIPKGSRILCNYFAANIDPEEFEDPLSFRLNRTHNRAVTFGIGPHRCSGVTLARMELRIMVEELFSRATGFHWDGDQRDRRLSILATTWRAVDSVPIAFTPLPAAGSPRLVNSAHAGA